MQRNEVDATLTASQVGLGTPELWQRLSLELDGKTVLEKPHVSKKVLLKAVRMQADAMRYMVDEVERLHDKMSEMEREAKSTQKYVERVNTKLLTLQGQHEETNAKVYELEVVQGRQQDQLKKIDDVAAQIKSSRDELRLFQQRVDVLGANYDEFVAQTEQSFTAIRQDQEVTKQFAMQLEDRLNTEEKELFLDSDHILHNKLSLAMWIEVAEKENRKKDEALRDCSDRMTKQGKNVQEMILETRRTLDDNTCAVEDVQRALLEKADRKRVDEAIESKYEEICNQLDKALASVIGEEDEFKRVSQELQQLVTHLSESKADRKDLLEIKEQVLYDSRVRQQVENLRSFIDLKMNRDDVFSALKNKADKDEMIALLKSLSEGMNASIVQAQKTLGEPENAFLTGKNALPHGAAHGSQKRGGMLPSLEKERCLSCNSTLRDPATNGSGSGVVNKNPHQMTPVFGGGFAVGSPAPGDKGAAGRAGGTGGSGSSSSNNNNSHNHSAPYLPSGLASSSSTRIASLSDSASEGFLLGVDGHVYQGDPEIIAAAQIGGASSSTASRAAFKAPNAHTRPN
ncbi:hypothetical protein PybrP1_011768 [[Pythium] brassicae (nom. inval.)]|nr:hypothetical protein PybrP1_011768 [[Pythium] brassicae (nom. inval.)]